MRDLIASTGVPRETIHYYAREGLLPAYDKTSHNQADYGPEHVDRILMIKELQDKYFLPISVIKRIIREKNGVLETDPILKIKSEYLNPLDQLLPGVVTGEDAFLELTGMAPDRLADFEEWGILNPQASPEGKVYSLDDINIGKLIGDMRRLGVSYENGFKRSGLKDYRDHFMPILEAMADDFKKAANGRFSRQGLEKLSAACVELMPVFFYHLSHIILKQRLTETVETVRTADGD